MPSESLVERYRNAGLSLLPPGRALTKTIGEALPRLIEALSVEWARIHEEIESVRAASVPGQAKAGYGLEEWEEALGLPGSCVTQDGSEVERQGAVVTKLLGRVSHAQAAFTSAAERLGYDEVTFERVAFFEAGESGAGDVVVGDEWAHYVRAVVLAGNETADDILRCTFVDELRRSHGFIDVFLEGPMGASRTGLQTYMNPAVQTSSPLALGGFATVLANMTAIPIAYSGFLSIQCRIDNGAGAVPGDSPQGAWELWTSIDGINWTKVTGAATELAKISPVGDNAVVDAVAILSGVPGTQAKLLYVRTGGGATTSRVRMQVASW